MVKTKVGLILGEGLDELPIFKNPVDRPFSTIYGDPGSNVIECQVDDNYCTYVNRSGKRLGLQVASKVNHRANVWALKEKECSHIIGVTVDGSLKSDLHPGAIIILDDFCDNTTGREKTFHDGQYTSPKGVMIVPMIPAFNSHFRKCVIDAAEAAGVKVVAEGTAIVIDGHCSSTKMELQVYKQFKPSVISTSLTPEAILAKEAGMLYVGISLVAFNAEEKTTIAQIVRCSEQNRDNVAKLLNAAIAAIHKSDWDQDFEELLVSN